jgi:hypothetical protein
VRSADGILMASVTGMGALCAPESLISCKMSLEEEAVSHTK